MTTALAADGWPGIADENDVRLGNYLIPGTSIKVRLLKTTAPVLLAFAAEWNEKVCALAHVPADVWSWQYRVIGTTTLLSTHSSGNALDLGATRFPQHAHKATPAQIATIHAMLIKYEVLEWGGDWSETYLDQMHVQIKQGTPPGTRVVSQAEVNAVIAKLRLAPDGTVHDLPPIWPALTGYDRQFTGTTWIYRNHANPTIVITAPLPPAKPGTSRVWNGHAWQYVTPAPLPPGLPPPRAGYDRVFNGKVWTYVVHKPGK